jgi:hypothetical protein
MSEWKSMENRVHKTTGSHIKDVRANEQMTQFAVIYADGRVDRFAERTSAKAHQMFIDYLNDSTVDADKYMGKNQVCDAFWAGELDEESAADLLGTDIISARGILQEYQKASE